MSATLFLTKDRLTTALTRDKELQNLQIGLQMEFLRRGWAELPPPLPLQRVRRYYPNLQTDVRSLRDIIHRYPRVNTLFTTWIAIARTRPNHILIAEMKELRDFLKAAPRIIPYFPAFSEGGHEVAVLYLLRCQTTNKRIHSAIRQAIISPEHNFLHTYGLSAAGRIAETLSDGDPIPSYIRNPSGEMYNHEYNYDMQLGVAMALLHEYMETLVPEYAPLCRCVRIGQELLRRAPLILHQFKGWGWTTAPTIEAWYGFCLHARNLEEMREILDVAGLEVGVEP